MTKEEIEKKYKDNIDFENNLIKNSNLIPLENHLFTEDNHETIIFKNINFTNIDITVGNITNNGSSYQFNNISDSNKIIFRNCKFIDRLKLKKNLNYNFEFNDCKFDKINFNDIKKTQISHQNVIEYFNYKIEFIKSEIDEIDIKECEFNGRFYINREIKRTNKSKINTFKIESLKIENTYFNENFKLHNSDIDIVEINNVDFEKNADFYKSKFSKKNGVIEFMNINFRNLTIFEKCEFRSKFSMEYVTFEGLVQFRGAKFYSGLDLDKTNIEKEINFYNVIGLDKNSSIKQTSQETYRIIKYNCERIGNIIDANKYHALELQKKKENLKFEDEPLEWIVFYINKISSNFGTNWLYAIGWIIVIGFLTMIGMNFDKLMNLYNSRPITYFDFPYYRDKIITKTFTYMSIVHYKELEAHPIIFFFNKVTLGYLYYQFVTAVRKDTRK